MIAIEARAPHILGVLSTLFDLCRFVILLSIVIVVFSCFFCTLLVGTDWGARIHPSLIDNIGKYRKYNYATVRDLLRVIRNKAHHFRDLPVEVQTILGPPPEAFLSYFSQRFPLLFVEVWKHIAANSKLEPTFTQYFTLPPNT